MVCLCVCVCDEAKICMGCVTDSSAARGRTGSHGDGEDAVTVAVTARPNAKARCHAMESSWVCAWARRETTTSVSIAGSLPIGVWAPALQERTLMRVPLASSETPMRPTNRVSQAHGWAAWLAGCNYYYYY